MLFVITSTDRHWPSPDPLPADPLLLPLQQVALLTGVGGCIVVMLHQATYTLLW